MADGPPIHIRFNGNEYTYEKYVLSKVGEAKPFLARDAISIASELNNVPTSNASSSTTPIVPLTAAQQRYNALDAEQKSIVDSIRESLRLKRARLQAGPASVPRPLVPTGQINYSNFNYQSYSAPTIPRPISITHSHASSSTSVPSISVVDAEVQVLSKRARIGHLREKVLERTAVVETLKLFLTMLIDGLLNFSTQTLPIETRIDIMEGTINYFEEVVDSTNDTQTINLCTRLRSFFDHMKTMVSFSHLTKQQKLQYQMEFESKAKEVEERISKRKEEFDEKIEKDKAEITELEASIASLNNSSYAHLSGSVSGTANMTMKELCDKGLYKDAFMRLSHDPSRLSFLDVTHFEKLLAPFIKVAGSEYDLLQEDDKLCPIALLPIQKEDILFVYPCPSSRSSGLEPLKSHTFLLESFISMVKNTYRTDNSRGWLRCPNCRGGFTIEKSDFTKFA